MTHKKKEKWGLFLGFIAVSLFGLTLPMTRVAVSQLDPVMVGMGRSLIASLVAALILWLRRSPWPSRKEMSSLILIGLCISAIFPILTASVMRTLPASHGAIVIGLLPLSTAYCVSFMNHEKASGNFWLASFFGSITVVGYALLKSGGMIHWADVLLLSTVVAGGIGYARGAILARTMGGLNVMCWALVSVMPILALGAVPQFIRLHPEQISWHVWGAFIYLALISQLFGMGLWYKALSLGSISRVSQVQLLQPFFTIVFAAVFFGEHVDALTWAAAIIVVLSIQLSRKAQVDLKVQLS